MPLSIDVGLDPDHTVLDGDPAPPPPKTGLSPLFSAHVCCGQTSGGIKMPLGMEAGLGLGDIVLDGVPASPPKKEHRKSPTSGPISIVAIGQKVAHRSNCRVLVLC